VAPFRIVECFFVKKSHAPNDSMCACTKVVHGIAGTLKRRSGSGVLRHADRCLVNKLAMQFCFMRSRSNDSHQDGLNKKLPILALGSDMA
jgi:hypothetical protein